MSILHDAGEALIYTGLICFGLSFGVLLLRGIWITVKRQWK